MITILPSCSHYLRRLLKKTLESTRFPDLIEQISSRRSRGPSDDSPGVVTSDLDSRLNFLYPDGPSCEKVVLHIEQLTYSHQHAQMTQDSPALQAIAESILWWLGYVVSIDCVSPKILVVDDTIETLKLTSAILSQASYEVDSVLTGQLALHKIASVRPDLILLDVKLPDIDGYQVYKQLQQLPDTASIPVIFLSGVDSTPQMQGAGYLLKPFKPRDLLKSVSHYLEAPLSSGRSLSSEWVNRQRQAHQLFSPVDLMDGATGAVADNGFLGVDSTAFFRATLEGRYLRVSQGFAHLCGYESAAEMMATVSNVWSQGYAHPAHHQRWQGCVHTPNQVKTWRAQLMTKQKTIIESVETVGVVQDKYGHRLFYQGWMKA